MAVTREAQRAALDDLKAQWLADPQWDIEDTEGFEWAREELIAFRLQKAEEWARLRQQRVQARADALGCSVELMHYLEGLERRIKQLEDVQGQDYLPPLGFHD